MGILDIRLFGGFRLTYDGGELNTVDTNRLQSLLAYLVIQRHSPLPRRQIAFLFWPDSSEAQARTNLRNLLHLLHEALPESDNYLSIDGQMIQWRSDSDFVLDVAEFEEKLASGNFSEAASLYAGDLLPDCYDEWVIDERERLRQMYLNALQQLLQHKEAESDYRAAIDFAKLIIRREPLSEHTYRDLMRLHALNGDRTGVYQAYNACAAVLQSELNVEPSIGTRDMFAQCQKMISAAGTNAGQADQNHSNTLAIILAGGEGKKFKILFGGSAKPAIPFAGKYRAIDFVLSNVMNSNLIHIAVLTQLNSHAIIDHIKNGEFWGPDQQQLPQIQIWEPSITRTGHLQYSGTADAVYQNRDYIVRENCDNVLILAGDHIYHQDYRDLLRFHKDKGADLTIAVIPVSPEDTHRFGMVDVDRNQRITHFVEKPKETDSTLASMGIYVFKTPFLLKCLEKDAQDNASGHDFGRSIIPFLIESCKVYAYRYNGYWVDIDTIETYWKSSLALLGNESAINLRDPTRMFQVHSGNTSPADIRPTGLVMNSLIADGCVIEGEVLHSILSPGVQIEKGAIVHNSIVMDNSIIHSGASIKDCLIGSGVEIGANASIGGSGALEPNQTEPYLISGITVIGNWAHIPDDISIERNCFIEDFVKMDDFKDLRISSGSCVRKSSQQHDDLQDTFII